MARPIKPGLDYFPLDVDFFEDPKLKFVSILFGEYGELIAIKLLCDIYKGDGCYMPWNEDRAVLLSNKVGRNISVALVNNVVNELLKRDFFNKDVCARFSILTSNGLQKRYSRICRDAKKKFNIKKEYDVMEKEEAAGEEKGLTPEETAIIPGETAVIPGETGNNSGDKCTNKRKEKETKEEETTLNKSTAHVHTGARETAALKTGEQKETALTEWQKLIPLLPANLNDKKQVLSNFITAARPDFIEPYATLWNIFAGENGLVQVQHLTPERRQRIKARSREPIFNFVQCLVQIRKSPFAKGLTASKWKVDFDYIIRNEDNYVKILEGKFET